MNSNYISCFANLREARLVRHILLFLFRFLFKIPDSFIVVPICIWARPWSLAGTTDYKGNEERKKVANLNFSNFQWVEGNLCLLVKVFPSIDFQR